MPDAYIDRRCNHGTCGGKTHYVVQGRCQNCAWDGYVWITLGHTKVTACSQAVCPRCGCREVRGGEYVSV